MSETRSALPSNDSSAFLAGLDAQAAGLVLEAAHKKQAPANQTILTSGEPATRLYLMRRGRVRYYKPTKAGSEVLLNWLTPGDVFGLGTLLANPPPYIGSAETISDCELLVWNHLRIRKLAQLYPQLAENALRIVLKYLKIYAERHVSIVTDDAEHRLAHVLLDLAHRTGKVAPEGVEIDATNEQLSDLAHISPFTTSRLLNGWSKKGFVSKRREKVLVHTPEALVSD